MSELPVYRMSEAGACPRLLAAMHLHYDFPPDTDATLRIFKEGKRHEVHIAEDIQAEDNLHLRDAKTCQDCLVETGEIKEGHHVEFSTFLARIVGHIDRIAVLSTGEFPVEIKALGRFRFEQFKRNPFVDFGEYAAQECCYLHCRKSPGLYVVKCRDTGDLLRYDIAYNGEFAGIRGYSHVTLPTTIDQVLDNIHTAELSVQEGKLPDVSCDEKLRRWCKAKFLCNGKESNSKESNSKESNSKEINSKESNSKEKAEAIEVISSAPLAEAAILWREGKEYERMAKEAMDSAKGQFLSHARANKLDKFQISGLRIGYYGTRQRDYLSEEKLKGLLTPEMLRQVYVPGKPFEDIRIRES